MGRRGGHVVGRTYWSLSPPCVWLVRARVRKRLASCSGKTVRILEASGFQRGDRQPSHYLTDVFNS